ncbi:MAG: alpha-glucoside transport system permease protein [Candidatus Promineifilaceae bacterium]|jgi:alpha-glucoside transport system permease protein
MSSSSESKQIEDSTTNNTLSMLGGIALAIGALVITFGLLYWGFLFLRDGDASQTVKAVVAIFWGVGGLASLFYLFNNLIEWLPGKWSQRLQPLVFVGPAVAILSWYLAIPTIRTFWISLFDRDGPDETLGFLGQLGSEGFVGLSNYAAVFTERLMIEAFRNNLLWILFGSTLSVVFGLLIAVLADRSRFEKFAKSMIFLPMAISFVGASVIWNFIYEFRPVEQTQIGLLNAIVVAMGGTPQSWPQWVEIAPFNNLFLIVIVVWLQSGFAMVLFSAALKGIPQELMEASRIDGATEIQIFFRIMIPYIQGTIITVFTTVVIFTLKIFDVVWVMTGGQFGTHVIATQFYRQSFTNRNSGYGSAIAIVLLIAVIPVMIYNLRQFRKQEAF